MGDDIKNKKEKIWDTRRKRSNTAKTTCRLRVKRDLKMTGVLQTRHGQGRVGQQLRSQGCGLQSTQDASCYWTLFLTQAENSQVSWPRFSPGLVYLSALIKCLFSTPLHTHKSILLGPTSESRSKAMAGFKSKISSSHRAIKPGPQLLSPCT